MLQLQQRITSLQELRRQQQVHHGQQVNALLAQIKDMQGELLLAVEQRKAAESKMLTARK